MANPGTGRDVFASKGRPQHNNRLRMPMLEEPQCYVVPAKEVSYTHRKDAKFTKSGLATFAVESWACEIDREVTS
jgi:hypothetical protein